MLVPKSLISWWDLGVGALMGVLFAPKSGEETREFLAKRADEGRDFAQNKARNCVIAPMI